MPSRKNVRFADDLYSSEEIYRVFQGYRMLDTDGALSRVLAQAAKCDRCAERYPERDDLPFNILVRPLPLAKLGTMEAAENYRVRLHRDHGFFIKRLELTTEQLMRSIVSEKFTIGLHPWLDRCMLHRSSPNTKLMVVGIDFKHLGPFLGGPQDPLLPLDSYRRKNDIWGKSWTRFWAKLLGRPYDDDKVDNFLAQEGAYFTNSQLCFGGSTDRTAHVEDYLETCRPHIKSQISIVRPEVLVSFGVFGRRNAAHILLEENPGAQASGAARVR